MLRMFLAMLLNMALAFQAFSQTDTYSTTLKKYLEVSGTLGSFKSGIATMITSFKGMKPNVPDQFWKDMEAEFLKTKTDDLFALLAPVYKRHLSESELNDAIKFYNTPVGKKLAEKNPVITAESREAEQMWGQKIAGQLLERLKEKGY